MKFGQKFTEIIAATHPIRAEAPSAASPEPVAAAAARAAKAKGKSRSPCHMSSGEAEGDNSDCSGRAQNEGDGMDFGGMGGMGGIVHPMILGQ